MIKPRIKGQWFDNGFFGKDLKWTHNNCNWFYGANTAIECAYLDKAAIPGASDA